MYPGLVGQVDSRCTSDSIYVISSCREDGHTKYTKDVEQNGQNLTDVVFNTLKKIKYAQGDYSEHRIEAKCWDDALFRKVKVHVVLAAAQASRSETGRPTL